MEPQGKPSIPSVPNITELFSRQITTTDTVQAHRDILIEKTLAAVKDIQIPTDSSEKGYTTKIMATTSLITAAAGLLKDQEDAANKLMTSGLRRQALIQEDNIGASIINLFHKRLDLKAEELRGKVTGEKNRADEELKGMVDLADMQIRGAELNTSPYDFRDGDDNLDLNELDRISTSVSPDDLV